MKHIFSILVLILLINIGDGFSQNRDFSILIDKLAIEGFKNVAVSLEGNDIVVFYENSMYRSDLKGISEVLKIVDAVGSDYNIIHLIVQKTRVPVIYISISSQNLKLLILNDIVINASDKIDAGYEVSRFNSKGVQSNSSQFFNDLVVHPDLGLQLGNYDNPFRFQLNLHPELNTYFWRGSRVGIKVNLPLVEKKFVDKYNYVRPESVVLEQFFRVRNAVFGRFIVGMFNNQRYGFNLESGAWLLNGRIHLNGSIAYTGYMAYLKEGTPGIYSDIYNSNVLEKSKLDYFQYFGDVEYRFPKSDLSVKVGYGEYLYHNKAFSFEMLRNFEEFVVGIKAYSGSTGETLEGRIIIPLIPNKYLNKQRLRVRMANHYDYSHTVGSAYYRSFNSGQKMDRNLWELNPQYIKNNLHYHLSNY